jgi:integrative and conjugative element protein (TIGR02256 family)
MGADFHELNGFREEAHPDSFCLPRAKDLVSAVQEAEDYTLVQLLSSTLPDKKKAEVLIIDVVCDGVPSQNQVGIKYRERLALWVPDDAAALIEVLALRKSFPVLMHQNNGTHNGPASLCLYFEPISTVTRTWTPQRFLRRIQWWLEQSAKGELHPADQPVEQLFFASNFELVLPWNFDELRNKEDIKMALVRSPSRPDGGCTFCLKPIGSASNLSKGLASYIELTLPTLVQGLVERDPFTLGELSSLLAQRGVNLLPLLNAALSDGIGSGGVPIGDVETCAVIILHIPMVREPGGDVQRIACRAFLISENVHQLGVKTGALTLHEKRYFAVAAKVEGSFLAHEPVSEWKDEPIFPMSVLKFPDSPAALKQSSVNYKGPRGVLVGAGSLGSAMLNLWTRSGWGEWSVIDKDHVKPHNLVRHIAFADHVGELKCNVAAELSTAATDGAVKVTAINGDACDLGAQTIQESLRNANLIVDVSAALDFPRQSSFQSNLPRHATVFVTPNGNGSVLMMEDHDRKIRLRSLEAQYYRALIRQPWGARHLDGNLSTYWSGASCRDISVAMPYSRVMVHASTLAEQVMLYTQADAANIRIWDRDAETGGISTYNIEPKPERQLDFDDLAVFFDEGLAAHLNELRLRALPNETGGVLLGYYDFNVNAIVIVDALPAPSDSQASYGSFERGTVGLLAAVQEASRRTADIVGYVGEWHSHPPGHSATPSRDDVVQLFEISLGMHMDGLPALQLIVGEDDIQVLQGKMKS